MNVALKGRELRVRDGNGDRRLSDASRSVNGDEARRFQEVRDLAYIIAAADHPGQWKRELRSLNAIGILCDDADRLGGAGCSNQAVSPADDRLDVAGIAGSISQRLAQPGDVHPQTAFV